MCTVQYTPMCVYYTVQTHVCVLYSAHPCVCTIQCTPMCVYYTVHTLVCVLYSIHPKMHEKIMNFV